MTTRLTIGEEKNLRQAALKTAGVLLLAVVCFIAAAIIGFSLVHLCQFGFTAKSFDGLFHFWKRFVSEPWFLPEVFGKWWKYLLKSIEYGKASYYLFFPLLAPLSFLLVVISAVLKSPFSFSLWYVLLHRFAKAEDVRKMGLDGGGMLVLGNFQGKILGTGRPASVLCFGEAGSGKTSSVAIPSVLQADGMSILAVDNSGTLAKYTSGYRAQLGKVFYFNWDLEEEPDKGSLYPRWNPLGKSNLPVKGAVRDDYIGFLAAYLSGYDKDAAAENYWSCLAYTAMNTLLQFMISKTEQAAANDYFLNQILEKKRLGKDDKDILLSYYAAMPAEYAESAIENMNSEQAGSENYFPVGSWEGIPPQWQGREVCLSMLSDWLLKNYLTERIDESHNRDCKTWLEALLAEAVLFNYNAAAINGLRQLAYLSKRQREVVFPMILKPLKVFRNPIIREKTSGNDFGVAKLRGWRNPETQCWEPVTVYCTASTKSSKFVSRLFIEAVMRQNLQGFKFKGPFPAAVIMDDVGQMLKVEGLLNAVSKGAMNKMSFVLLCNSLHNLEQTYGRETVEYLVANTNYKIVMAEDNILLSRQLNKLAVYGTRSVQIPDSGSFNRRKMRRGFADANFYHLIAKDLLSPRRISVETKGYQLLLAEGFYHRPVLTENAHFIKNENFKEKALLEARYFLDASLAEKRNSQDYAVPKAEDVLYDSDLGIDDETELDQYLDIIYNEAAETIHMQSDKASVLAEEISSKWKKDEEPSGNKSEDGNDWWLREDAFAPQPEMEKQNSLEKK